jgi:hypothetical protein
LTAPLAMAAEPTPADVQREIEKMEGKVEFDPSVPGQVVKVRVGNCHRAVTDGLIAKLKVFPHLRELRLGSCGEISDDALRHLQQLPELEMLFINCGSNISERGLAHLQALPKLDRLYLRYCKVSAGGIEAFKARRPACRVVLDEMPR